MTRLPTFTSLFLSRTRVVIRVTEQKYWCYHGCRFLQPLTEILPEQMCFCAVQQKGQGNDDRKRIEWRIAFQLSADENRLFTCTPLIGMQGGGFHKCSQPMIKFSLRYSEEPCKFSLCHGYLSVSLANDLHIAAPIKIATMILRASHCPLFIVRIHAVSSILQIDVSKSSKASLSIVSLSFADCLAISLSISFEILLSVTCA